MAKVHTRIKRKMQTFGRTRAVRPKSFKSEESAHAYATANGIKDYTLVDSDFSETTCKIKIVQEKDI